MSITYDEFAKVELISGTIVKTEAFPQAKKPAYKIDEIIGKQVVGCVNLGTKNIAGFISEFLLVGFAYKNDKISLINIDHKIPNGQKLC